MNLKDVKKAYLKLEHGAFWENNNMIWNFCRSDFASLIGFLYNWVVRCSLLLTDCINPYIIFSGNRAHNIYERMVKSSLYQLKSIRLQTSCGWAGIFCSALLLMQLGQVSKTLLMMLQTD